MKKRCKKENNQGFSLVELIIVIAIMAILVGVIASQVIPYMEKSRESRDLYTLDSYLASFSSSIAEEEYVADVDRKKLSELPENLKKKVAYYIGKNSNQELREALISGRAGSGDVLFTKKASGSGFVLQVEAGQLSVNNYEGASK